MANMKKLVNKSKTIEERAKTIASNLMSQYKHGKIKTQNELIYRTFNALKNFYESIGKPTMQKRYAGGAPFSSHYNDTMKEISDDINIIMTESDNLSYVLGQTYNQVEIDRQLLGNQINLIEKQLDKARLKVSNMDLENIFIDSFINMEYTDNTTCSLAPVSVNTNFGYISLATQESNTIKPAEVQILDDSNGLPGNTHQAYVVNNEVKFIGEEGLHTNLAHVLDENSDTWFEYELYKISDQTRISTLNLGYMYDEGKSWVSDDTCLKLNIKTVFLKAELTNTLALSPFIPPDKDAIPSIIKSIKISDGKGNVRELINGIDVFDKDKVYTFPKQFCKYVVVELLQEMPYLTNIGHIYYKQLNNQNINFFKANENKFNQRVKGPNPSIENVGIVYDDEELRYIQPTYGYGQEIDNEEYIKNNLFKIPSLDSNIQGHTELLQAQRYHIGIRDLVLSSYSYEPESEYNSVSFKSETPINSVELNVSEFIPEDFENLLDENGDKIDWIRYFIAVDEELSDWKEIIPIGTYKLNGFSKYILNSNTPAELRRDDVGYIETEKDIHNVKLKIVIKRPTDIQNSEYYSPIVFEYKILTN